MFDWKFFSILGALLVTFSRIGRRYLFNNCNYSLDKSWYYITLGFFIGVLFELSYNFNENKIINLRKNMSWGFVFIGLITYLVFKVFNIALFKSKNPGWVSAVFAGLATALTYFISIFLFNQKINKIKLLGIVFTICGVLMIVI
jgi:multidrug transporter EmrE-like cation transporter